MARDNSPKERQKKELARKTRQRPTYDRILIVTEGSKTEPNYFREIRTAYRLHAASVEVRYSELGTAPVQVVQYAEELFKHGDSHKNITARAFEKVYVVFDRDDHLSYYEALRLTNSIDGSLKNDLRQRVSFKAVASIPNFELWLLLHYEDIQAPIHRINVLHRLKQHIPNYDKGMRNVFAITRENLHVATNRAKNLALRFSATTDPEPFTNVVELVTLLTSLNPRP